MPFDRAVCFRVTMFIPIGQRVLFVEKRKLIKPGRCITVVDKLNTLSGYFGIWRRLTMQWKVNTGVSAQEIIEKELSWRVSTTDWTRTCWWRARQLLPVRRVRW